MTKPNLLECTDLSNELASAHPPQLLQVTSLDRFCSTHIPNAKLVQPQQLVDGTPPATGRLPSLNRLQALFDSIDYQPSERYVVFDDEGGGWAGRMAWTLDVIGHSNWAYLNGGLHAWAAEGRALTSSAAPEEAQQSSAEIRISDVPVAEIPDILSAIESGDTAIWDARSFDEYAGKRSGSQRRGHIPTARSLDWEHLRDPEDCLKLPQNWQERVELVAPPDRRIITHCQSHHRSGLTYMVARLAGRQVKAYHGSWSEWGNHPETPISSDPEAPCCLCSQPA